MGMVVGFGVAMPGPGSHLLNVEDEAELREQRSPLWRSAVVVLLVGAMMLALSLAGAGDWSGLLSPDAAAIVVGSCILGTSLLSYFGRKDNDELMRSIAREGAAWGMYACLAIFTVWGSLAHLGYVAWITPLGLVNYDPTALFVGVDSKIKDVKDLLGYLRLIGADHLPPWVVEDLRRYLAEPRWYQTLSGAPARIAYFSPEFGVSEVLPQYSGGLGVLAGDHLKAASDLGLPLVGIGLMYRHGYFRQRIDALLLRGAFSGNPRFVGMCNELYDHRDSLW